jgi:hypothetical protein
MSHCAPKKGRAPVTQHSPVLIGCKLQLVQRQYNAQVQHDAHKQKHYEGVDEVSICKRAAIELKGQLPEVCAAEDGTNEGRDPVLGDSLDEICECCSKNDSNCQLHHRATQDEVTGVCVCVCVWVGVCGCVGGCVTDCDHACESVGKRKSYHTTIDAPKASAQRNKASNSSCYHGAYALSSYLHASAHGVTDYFACSGDALAQAIQHCNSAAAAAGGRQSIALRCIINSFHRLAWSNLPRAGSFAVPLLLLDTPPGRAVLEHGSFNQPNQALI